MKLVKIKNILLLLVLINSKIFSQCPPTLANLSYIPLKAKYCIGDNITINYITSDIIVNLDWDFQGIPNTTQTSPSNVFNITNLIKGGPLIININTIDPITGIPCQFTLNDYIYLNDLIADAGQNVIIAPPLTSAIIGGNPTGLQGTPPYNYLWTPNTNINSTTISNPVVNPNQTTTYQVTVTDADLCTANASVMVYNASSIINNKYYAILKKTLDAGYYDSVNSSGNILYFKFDEEYFVPASSNLTYRIFDDAGAQVTTTPNLIKNIGDNRYALNVASLTTGSYYKLYVYNQKNEVWQTRIKIN